MLYQYLYIFFRSFMFEIYQLNRNGSKSFVFYCVITPVYEFPCHGVEIFNFYYYKQGCRNPLFLKKWFCWKLINFFFLNEALFILPISCFSSFGFYWICCVWPFFRSAFLNTVLLPPHVVFVPFIFLASLILVLFSWFCYLKFLGMLILLLHLC